MTLEIIGAGFGRTGTNSLKLALEQLGFGPCHHMFELRDHPELVPDWEAAANGQKMDWQQVFRNYRSQVDWPGARYWRELTLAFPDAKVILSIRDPNEWFDSVQATIGPFMEAHGKHDAMQDNARAEMQYKTIVQQVFDGRLSDRDYAIGIFKKHVEEVQASIPKERLLTFAPNDGWEALCRFLNKDIPDTPYPNSNSTKQFAERTARRVETN